MGGTFYILSAITLTVLVSVIFVFVVRKVIQKIFIKTIDLEILSRQIDNMSGHDFDTFLNNVFIQKGYKVQDLPKVGDFGCDLIAEKDGVKIAVQAKRYGNKVNLKAVQEVYSGKDFYGCDVAIVITNNTYQPSAIKLARKIGVVLWTKQELNEFIKTGDICKA